MIDPRFYVALGPLPAAKLAAGLPVLGDGDASISSLAPLVEAGSEDLCFLDAKTADWPQGRIGCLVVSQRHAANALARARAVIVASSAKAHFSRAAPLLARPRRHEDPGPAPVVEAGARVAPTAVIGPGVEIGAGAQIGPYAVVGPGVCIGRGAEIGAHCVLQCAFIGDDVRLGPGTVVGEAGYGVAGDGAGLVDTPHFGRVILQDRVRIGANCTVDRGMLDDTMIGEDTKIDSLCHVAHNVRVGRAVLIAAFGGISGSVVVGDGVRMGGRVGIGDHVRVGEGASLAAGAAVLQDVGAGETVAGYPAKAIRTWMREIAWLKRSAGKKE